MTYDLIFLYCGIVIFMTALTLSLYVLSEALEDVFSIIERRD